MTHSAVRSLAAADAVARLGVSRQTLYSYVSRGLIRAVPEPDDPRRSRYDAGDVDALVERRGRGRARRDVAASTVDWGEPILRTSLTRIARGRYFYRGQDATVLAETATLETVAALLWDQPSGPVARPLPRPGPDGASALQRCLLALATQVDQPRSTDPATLLHTVTQALTGPGGGEHEGAHRRFAAAWGLDVRGAELVRRAMVLCADHELNASAYAARIVASTGASLAACVLAGLSALSGPLHGGMTDRVVRLLADPAVTRDPERAFAGGRDIPGFGHRLYPAGDPRATSLLAACAPSPMLRRAIDAASAAAGQAPTVDVALAVLELELGLPRGGGFAVFAAGRTVGWIAHALEQRAEGRLIRPRADYVTRHPGGTTPGRPRSRDRPG